MCSGNLPSFAQSWILLAYKNQIFYLCIVTSLNFIASKIFSVDFLVFQVTDSPNEDSFAFLLFIVLFINKIYFFIYIAHSLISKGLFLFCLFIFLCF